MKPLIALILPAIAIAATPASASKTEAPATMPPEFTHFQPALDLPEALAALIREAFAPLDEVPQARR